MSDNVALRLLKRRFTVEEYERMGQAGILSEDDRVELIDGEIIEMPPIGSPHSAVTSRLAALLARAVQHRAIFRIQDPIRLGVYSQPQPDVVLVKPRDDYYASAHPGPEDVLLVAEVSDTTVDYDREVKIPLYARAGVRGVWIIDLATKEVEVFRRPYSGKYQTVSKARRGEVLSVETLPSVTLPVDQVLG